MRPFFSTVASVAALGLLFVGGSGPCAANSQTAGAVMYPGKPSLVSAHLYLGYDDTVWAYPIANGVVSSQFDAQLTSAGDPIAIGPRGGLYATEQNSSSPAAPQVVTLYSTPGLTPLRALNIAIPRNAYALQPTALAVDPHGFLFVAYWTQSAPHKIGAGIYVYRPYAKGNDQPIVTLQLPDHSAYGAYGMAFDAQGNLYASRLYKHDILVYATPTTTPMLVRRINGPEIRWPVGLRIDSKAELYVECGVKPPYVLAYADTASGDAKPDRRITPIGTFYNSLPGNGVATDGDYLFMSTDQGVVELKKLVSGEQTLLAQTNRWGNSIGLAP